MSHRSSDAKAVVHAIDALTTQFRRGADALERVADVLSTPVVEQSDDADDAPAAPVDALPPAVTGAPPTMRVAQWIAAPPTSEHRPVSLATPCANCPHPYNWHTPGNRCTSGSKGDPATPCGCTDFRPCPTPETHNWGCGCPTDQAPADDSARVPCPDCPGAPLFRPAEITDHIVRQHTAGAPAAHGPRCVCGGPIELAGDPAVWRHSPGGAHGLDAHTPRPPDWLSAGTRDLSTPEQAPAADEEQTLRWARRESLLVLLTRLQRGRTLTEDEARALREHVETEMREAETARTVAAGNKRHVGVLVSDLEQAQARVEQADAVTAETKRLLERRTTTLRRRAEIAEAELRTLRTGIRALGGDPTTIQNLWAQLRLRNRQWAEAKREARAMRAMLEEEGGDVALVDEMLATVEKAEGKAREAQGDTEYLRGLLAKEIARPQLQQAAIERVRAHVTGIAQTTAAGLTDYDIGSYELACGVLTALDGTEQPTTEEQR